MFHASRKGKLFKAKSNLTWLWNLTGAWNILRMIYVLMHSEMKLATSLNRPHSKYLSTMWVCVYVNSVENLSIQFWHYSCCCCCCYCCLEVATRSCAIFHSIRQHFVYIFGCVFNFAPKNVVYLPRCSWNSNGGSGSGNKRKCKYASIWHFSLVSLVTWCH